MEFCCNWNQPGSTCECNTCLGPWLETASGYWRHAFDELLFSHIKPKRNFIPLEDSDIETDDKNHRHCESPVSSISDQYSTDDTYTLENEPASTSSTITETQSSDGILANRDEVFEPSDSDTIIDDSSENDDIEEKNPTKDETESLLFDFTPQEQSKLERMFDSVFYPTPANTPNNELTTETQTPTDDNPPEEDPPRKYNLRKRR